MKNKLYTINKKPMTRFKTFVRTTVFRIIVIALFYGYIKRFDKDLGQDIAMYISPTTSTTGAISDTETNHDIEAIQNRLDSMQTQLGSIMHKLDGISKGDNTTTQTNDNPLETTQPQTVKLFYFNEQVDQALPPAQQSNVNSVQSVFRTIPATDNIVRDTIQLLLKGNLRSSEETDGFTTEFPNEQFALISTNFNNGTLTLEFTEVPGFTSGGSARMLILRATIEKTAAQFPFVDRVDIQPNTLFQP